MTAQMKRRTILIAGMTLLVSLFALAVVNVVYTAREVSQAKEQIRQESAKSQRNQCEIISLSTQPRPIPPQPPYDPNVQPETEYGKVLNKYLTDKAAYEKKLEEFNLKAGKALRDYSHKIGCDKL